MKIFRPRRMGIDEERLQADYRYESLRLLRFHQCLFHQVGKIKRIKDLAKHAGIELQLEKDH